MLSNAKKITRCLPAKINRSESPLNIQFSSLDLHGFTGKLSSTIKLHPNHVEPDADWVEDIKIAGVLTKSDLVTRANGPIEIITDPPD
jgi:hypothetical protein